MSQYLASDGNQEMRSSLMDSNDRKDDWVNRKWKTFCQLVLLIIDTPLDIPSVLVSLQKNEYNSQIEELLKERNDKYQMLTKIGVAYTKLCFLSLVALFILIVIGYIIEYIVKDSKWYLPMLTLSAIPIAISPVYWYKKLCLKNYLHKLDDYIHILEIYYSNVITPDYKSAIIGAYLLRNHARKLSLSMDLTPSKKKYSQTYKQSIQEQ